MRGSCDGPSQGGASPHPGPPWQPRAAGQSCWTCGVVGCRLGGGGGAGLEVGEVQEVQACTGDVWGQRCMTGGEGMEAYRNKDVRKRGLGQKVQEMRCRIESAQDEVHARMCRAGGAGVGGSV